MTHSHVHEWTRVHDTLQKCACGIIRKPRLRVTKESSSLLHFILVQSLTMQWDARAEAQRQDITTKGMNRTIKVTQQLLEEINTLREDFGWPDLRSAKTRSAPRASEREEGK